MFKSLRSRLVLASAVFSLVIVAAWVLSLSRSSRAVAFLGAGYALLCFGFLAAQIAAFVKAHMDYDETVERPKFDLLKLEEEA